MRRIDEVDQIVEDSSWEYLKTSSSVHRVMSTVPGMKPFTISICAIHKDEKIF